MAAYESYDICIEQTITNLDEISDEPTQQEMDVYDRILDAYFFLLNEEEI